MKKVIAILFSIALFSSCDETKKVIDVAGNVHLTGNYTVTSIGGSEISENAPTITFVALDKTIRGNTGCNSFFGKYALDLYALTMSDIGNTEMACDQPIMDVENAFLNALRNTGSYDLENSMLTLYSKTDRSELLIARKERNEGN
ncbi:META domain-containing protein [Aureisphaera galaxeae]|uniref:META domain-containing protein n=1 Tax=Aureisphaera galaxeae TaxID=1538023 RepID=UPI002350FBE5|nr:META domain-containing protein [Aureisphaera galaxeae]MDC8002605.1 META domain-containing protein [Aureisphaera galaxeae]